MAGLIDYSQVKHIFIVCGKTDMRRGIDSLAAIVTDTYQLDSPLFILRR